MSPVPVPWDFRKLEEVLASPLPAAEPPPIASIGRYRIIRELGNGATGIVYEAEDPEIRRPVALKLLRETAEARETARLRFQREARAAGTLSHPNVVRIFDAGEADGRMYLVMELVKGRPLSEVLASRTIAGPALLRLFHKAALGVAAAHQAGIIHRDLKPSNILVGDEGDPKVGDFGLAHGIDSDGLVTRSGTPIGTPAYMAPEQARGDRVDARADVYSLGAMLYEIVTERRPFQRASVLETLNNVVEQDVTPPRRINPAIDRDLETIILKCMDKDPSRRYANAGELAGDMNRFLDGEPIQARPASALSRLWRKAVRRRAVVLPITAACLVALAAGSWALYDGSRKRQDVQRAERMAADRKEAFARLEEGFGLAGRNDYDGQIAKFTEAIRLDPLLESAYFYRGLCHAFKGEQAMTVDDMTQVIRLNPGSAPAHLNRANAWIKLDRRDEAIADYRRALELFPSDWPERQRVEELLRRLRPREY